jgi:hypothetical protein
MKRYNDPVRVELDRRRRPVRVHRRGTAFRVQELVDWWVVEGRWWSGGERRIHFRLSTDHGIIELYSCGDTWTLYRMFD